MKNLSEDKIQEVKSKVRDAVEKQSGDPVRGNHFTSKRLHKTIDIDIDTKFCTRVMDEHCDFVERENSQLNTGTRFVIIEDKL